jgi:uncharacterized protein (TIGR02118 family)
MYAGDEYMHKLVILIDELDDWTAFDETWPQFLHHAESMPGLRREVTCRVDSVLYGRGDIALIHELYFDSLQALRAAMTSPSGSAAGRLLQSMTGGRMTLFFADHKEDDMENIRKYKDDTAREPDADTE